MADVLVTGATGFIGFHLVRALAARGDRVTCLVRKTSAVEQLQPLGVELVYGGLDDARTLHAAVAAKDVVYHVAGLTQALRAEQFYAVNRDGTRNIAQACAKLANPPVLVIVSSLAAAGPSSVDRPRVETDPPTPVSHYGRSKRQGELAAEALADRVPITIVRPPIVLGEWSRQGLPMFRAIARVGIHLVPGWFPYRYSVIHAADLAQALILAAERGSRVLPPKPEQRDPAARGFYFVASEDHPTYSQLGRMVGEVLGRRTTLIIPVAMPLVWWIACGVELTARARQEALYLNLDKAREVTAGSWTCSASRAREELGFSVGAPLRERLRQTAQWYRDQGWL
ncbi:MAG: NAD-dependent epimerase/dehydratase family protein [Thermoguttaceae bacterium]